MLVGERFKMEVLPCCASTNFINCFLIITTSLLFALGCFGRRLCFLVFLKFSGVCCCCFSLFVVLFILLLCPAMGWSSFHCVCGCYNKLGQSLSSFAVGFWSCCLILSVSGRMSVSFKMEMILKSWCPVRFGFSSVGWYLQWRWMLCVELSVILSESPCCSGGDEHFHSADNTWISRPAAAAHVKPTSTFTNESWRLGVRQGGWNTERYGGEGVVAHFVPSVNLQLL